MADLSTTTAKENKYREHNKRVANVFIKDGTKTLKDLAKRLIKCRSYQYCKLPKICKRCSVNDRKVTYTKITTALKKDIKKYRVYSITGSFNGVKPNRSNLKTAIDKLKGSLYKLILATFRSEKVHYKYIGYHYSIHVSTFLGDTLRPHIHVLLFTDPGYRLDTISFMDKWNNLNREYNTSSNEDGDPLNIEEVSTFRRVEKLLNYSRHKQRILYSEEHGPVFTKTVNGKTKLQVTCGPLKKVVSLNHQAHKDSEFVRKYPNFCDYSLQNAPEPPVMDFTSNTIVLPDSSNTTSRKRPIRTISKDEITTVSVNEKQLEIINSRRKHVIVNALPATGKSSVLRAYAESHKNESILYVCFDATLRSSSKSWGLSNLTCHTGHSLARSEWRELNTRYGSRLGEGLKTGTVSKVLNVTKDEAKVILNVLDKYWNSSDRVISEKHIKVPANCVPEMVKVVKGAILSLTTELWEMIQDKDRKIPIPHDAYLKMYCLKQSPLSYYSTILLDECQDLNHCLADFIFEQEDVKIIAVGDKNQSLYGFRLSCENFYNNREPTHHLTQSYRFGKEVADIGNVILDKLGWKYSLIGNGSIDTRIGAVPSSDKYTILSRTNFGLLDESIELIGTGKKLFLSEEKYLDTFIYLLEFRLKVIVKGMKIHEKYKTFARMCKEVSQSNVYKKYLKVIERLSHAKCKTFLKELESVSDMLVTDEREADVVLSTTHNQKGQTIDNVKVSDDFSILKDILEKDEITTKKDKDKLMVLFVAVTRARKSLTIPESLRELLLKDDGHS